MQAANLEATLLLISWYRRIWHQLRLTQRPARENKVKIFVDAEIPSALEAHKDAPDGRLAEVALALRSEEWYVCSASKPVLLPQLYFGGVSVVLVYSGASREIFETVLTRHEVNHKMLKHP